MLTYHSELPNVKEIVNKHWLIIDSSKGWNKIFPQKPIMAYRRPKSQRDTLVHAKLNPDPSDDGPTGKVKSCGNKRCFSYYDTNPICYVILSETQEADKLQICKCHLPYHVHSMWQTVRRRNKTCLHERINSHRSD